MRDTFLAIETQKKLKEERGEAGEEERKDTGHRVSMEEEGSPDMVKVCEEGIGYWALVEVVNPDCVELSYMVVEEAKVARIPYIASRWS